MAYSVSLSKILNYNLLSNKVFILCIRVYACLATSIVIHTLFFLYLENDWIKLLEYIRL